MELTLPKTTTQWVITHIVAAIIFLPFLLITLFLHYKHGE